MKSSNFETTKAQCRPKTPDSIIQLIATQLDRAEQAKQRIDEEGVVVRDLKGSVIAHPALKIESDAGKIAVDMLAKHKR